MTLTDRLRAWLAEHDDPDASSYAMADAALAALGEQEQPRESVAATVRRWRTTQRDQQQQQQNPPVPEQISTGHTSADAFEIDHDTRQYRFGFVAPGGVRWWDAPWGEVKDWCWWYATGGRGMTAREVSIAAGQTHGRTLTEEYVRRVMRVLGVTKSAPPFAPHDIMRHTPEEIERLAFARAQAEAGAALERGEARRLRGECRKLRRLLAEARAETAHVAELAEIVEQSVRVERERAGGGVELIGEAPAPDDLLVVGLYDVHLGKRGVDGCGLAAAVADVRARQERLARRVLQSRGRQRARVVLIFGGDWLHVDTYGHTTTRGTPQDTDGVVGEHIAAGMELARSLVELWRGLGAVDVVVVPGNHDRLACQWLELTLGAIYAQVDGVRVLGGQGRSRRVVEHGDILIACDHGDGPKQRDLVRLLAVEHPEAWGRTRWRYWLRGHLHHTREVDLGGVVVQQQPSPAGADRWHEREGYVGSERAMRVMQYTPGAGLSVTYHG